MKKVLDKDLEKKVEGIISKGKSGESAAQIILLLKELQDASGVKICTAITVTDVAYKEVL